MARSSTRSPAVTRLTGTPPRQPGLTAGVPLVSSGVVLLVLFVVQVVPQGVRVHLKRACSFNLYFCCLRLVLELLCAPYVCVAPILHFSPELWNLFLVFTHMSMLYLQDMVLRPPLPLSQAKKRALRRHRLVACRQTILDLAEEQARLYGASQCWFGPPSDVDFLHASQRNIDFAPLPQADTYRTASLNNEKHIDSHLPSDVDISHASKGSHSHVEISDGFDGPSLSRCEKEEAEEEEDHNPECKPQLEYDDLLPHGVGSATSLQSTGDAVSVGKSHINPDDFQGGPQYDNFEGKTQLDHDDLQSKTQLDQVDFPKQVVGSAADLQSTGDDVTVGKTHLNHEGFQGRPQDEDFEGKAQLDNDDLQRKTQLGTPSTQNVIPELVLAFLQAEDEDEEFDDARWVWETWETLVEDDLVEESLHDLDSVARWAQPGSRLADCVQRLRENFEELLDLQLEGELDYV